MVKRAMGILIAVCILLSACPVMSASVSAENEAFEERLLYGGTALDIGNMIYFSDETEQGFLFSREYGSDEKKLVVAEKAAYLNLFEGEIWFVSGSRIMRCDPDGSNLRLFAKLDDTISHLYVSSRGIYYLFGETVYLVSGGQTNEVFTREGMKGFIPEAGGGFRWIADNPNYVYVEENGDEYWGGAEDEYVSYLTYEAEGEDELLAGSAEEGGGEQNDYTGPYVKVGNTTLPLANHMPGTYFSKNGGPCTCHNTSSTYCIESVNGCNCMRYYPTGDKATCEVDLMGAQCFAFARMVFYTCFGFIDHSINASLYHSVGSIAKGSATANTVKELFMKAAPGAHVRLARGHSVSILTMDEDFLVIYHGNAGGDGVTSSPCIVSTRRYTWAQFASAAADGILYINMPFSYPDSSLLLTEKQTGYYRLNSNLNLRTATNTQSEIKGIVPINSMVLVTEVDGYWGKISYNNNEGWIFLEYTTFYSRASVTPAENSSLSVENGYLYGKAWRLDYSAFTELFDKQSLSITDKSGTDLSAGGYIGTGCRVDMVISGTVVDSACVAITGDINGNGWVDVGDYMAVRRYVLSTFDLSGEYLKAADFNGDSKVDATDYAALKRFFMGN